MSDTYVIQWKSKVNGRAGKGSKAFGREEAEQLADELNLEYPQILHEVVRYKPPSDPSNDRQPEESPEQEQAREPAKAFSFS